MPFQNPTYRKWDGQRSSVWTRWWTICETGIRRSMASKWLRRMMFAAFLPLLFFSIPFFLFEQACRDPDTWRMFTASLRSLPQMDRLRELAPSLGSAAPENTEEVRHTIWAFLLMTMQRYPQAFLMVIVVGVVAPPLISQDLRTRAYLIYFSRPIDRLEYIAGKFGVVAFYLLSLSAVPALILYILGCLLSASPVVFLSTWDLPLRILCSSVCLIVPATLLALALSSLTLESRYASFAWFAIWILGNVTYSALTAFPAMQANQRGQSYDPGWQTLTSPYQVLGQVQSAIFGFGNEGGNVVMSLLFLIGVSLLSFAVLMRRVSAPLRA